MSDWIDEAKDVLEDEQHPYLPDDLPDGHEEKSEKVSYAVGFAMVTWAIEEKGVPPKRAEKIVMSAMRDGAESGRIDIDAIDPKIHTN
jgi:hypothetical protein